jgi:uncharacterized protein YfaS (alpha-2-macroglobulin family)
MRFHHAAALILVAHAASGPAPLKVLRVTPSTDADPTTVVMVTFDRPVAGWLDRSIDPQGIVTITPNVKGKLEWRDPITIRFTPAAPLTPNTEYRVMVSNGFDAMDGSRLEAPYTFSFRVRGARLLAGSPVSAGNRPRFITPQSRFELLFSIVPDLDRLAATARLEFAGPCAGARTQVRLRPMSQRAVTDKDPYAYREAGGYNRNRAADSLRRVVSLVPEAALPLGCTGELVVPSTLDDEGTSRYERWRFETYSPLQLVNASCGTAWKTCPTGPIVVTFSTPVPGAEVLRRVRIVPAVAFVVRDTLEQSPTWTLEATLKPRSSYGVFVDSALTDVFGQRVGSGPHRVVTTTGYAPSVDHPYGRMLVERTGYRTIAVRHVNVDTLLVSLAPVPESLESQVLRAYGWNFDELWAKLAPGVTTRSIFVAGESDRPFVTGVRLPAYNAARAATPTLTAVRVTRNGLPESSGPGYRPRLAVAVVQVTDLGVHARIGVEEGVVWVTGVNDGQPRPGAQVTLYDTKGHTRATATTDREGLARLSGFKVDTARDEEGRRYYGGFDGYVAAKLGTDRAVTAVSAYDEDLSPWRFNVRGAWGDTRVPAAAAVFTERGIYRPGETVYAKAIVRTGPLGALKPPAKGDSLGWLFSDRENGALRDTTVALSSFGTAHQALVLPASLPLGHYRITIRLRRAGRWIDLDRTDYRVAEYRPPEFLVTATSDSAPRFAGDSFTARLEARYLFGAPMVRAAVSWVARQQPTGAWALRIPHIDGYFVGESGWWWEDSEDAPPDRQGVQVIASGTDTLDASGRLELRTSLGQPVKGLPAQVTLQATVTDVNRQAVSASTSTIMHPAAFYLAAKPLGTSYFWTAGKPQQVVVLAVRPDGRRVSGVVIRGAVVRREWHQVVRERAGLSEEVGEWVSDTVARCSLTSAADSVPCRFTPAAGGIYIVSFSATDPAGRSASTTFYRWATGKDWVPWNDENRFKMDVIPDKQRYSVGDTATVLFASPFTDAEAWLTLEREGLIEQRRLRITSGATTLRFPVTEALAPNAFVSILVTRGRTTAPKDVADLGRPTIRVGYAELRVTPEVKRLRLEIRPLAGEYRPGDTARVRVQVRDAAGGGRRAEVALWAVDEGVLSLTGYKTPDPIDLIYRERGLGMHLASNLVAVAAQVLSENVTMKGDEQPGGGGGAGAADVLRTRFQSTAFFLGAVVTDTAGRAVTAAKLPDNLTTFRVMAVAVTAGDRYGSGQSPLLVTRPLLARPALPRFLRRDDDFTAGVVVNHRAGGTPTVDVQASTAGAVLRGDARRTVTLAAGRGSEVRFAFRDTTSDTASFRFHVVSGPDADAVETRLPVQPAFSPRAHTAAGTLRDTASVEIALPDEIDPARSRVELDFGSSPLAVVKGAYRWLRVYPYDCTEQIASELLPLLALYQARQVLGAGITLPSDAKSQIESAVGTLSRRQRADGGIGLWSATDWTTPWLSGYAGQALVAARASGIPVSDSLLGRLAGYITKTLHTPQAVQSPVARWYNELRVRLADQVAAVDFLSQLGRPDLPAENDLLQLGSQLAWEDRVRLAEVVARRGAGRAARDLLQPVWATVRVEGRRAVLPDSAERSFYFYSWRRPAARLLTATLAVDSSHALLGPLVETLVQQQRGGRLAPWNTQDYGAAVSALVAFDRRQRRVAERGLRIRLGSRVLFESSAQPGRAGGGLREWSGDLTGLLVDGAAGGKQLRLTLDAPAGEAPVFYYLTVREVPRERPVTPDQKGIEVERWYEDFATGKPTVRVAEGQLVRVRLRVTVPAERQFVVVDDPLPAGLEAVDLSLRTTGVLAGPGATPAERSEGEETASDEDYYPWGWYYGSWDDGWWSPFDHKELRDDRVVYAATVLWKGTHNVTYVARATTPGVFVRPPAHAEEMYNPAVQGRSDGGVFTVTATAP